MLERFTEAQKMMKKMASGGAIPGMPGAGRGGARKAKGKGKGKKQKYGNPAKAAQAELEAKNKKANAPKGAAFGQGGVPEDFDPSSLNLPSGFEKYLGK